jgi:hypothetical protein
MEKTDMSQAESHMSQAKITKMHGGRRRRGGKRSNRDAKPQKIIGDNDNQLNQLNQLNQSNEIKPETIVSEKDKLKEKIKTLRSTRTGLERRQQLKVQKQSELVRGKLPKNGAHSLTRETIHDLLGKFGIHDMQVENDVMHEISSGRVKTPQDVALFMVRRLNLTHPQGPGFGLGGGVNSAGGGGGGGGVNSGAGRVNSTGERRSGGGGGVNSAGERRSGSDGGVNSTGDNEVNESGDNGNKEETAITGRIFSPPATLDSSLATFTSHRKKLQHPTVSLLK